MLTLLALPFSKVYGLPAHPLLVHAAVVLVPLAALALVAVGWKEAWRRVYYLPVTLLAVGGAGAAFLAKESGETLATAYVKQGSHLHDHTENGDMAFISAALLAAACVGVYSYHAFGESVRERLGLADRFRLPVDENAVLYAVSIPVALLAVVLMVIAGHSGAALVWKYDR
jgi:hypothetical protein